MVKVAQSHAASEWQSGGLNSGGLAAVSGPLPPAPTAPQQY